jgi:hypothetical protein
MSEEGKGKEKETELESVIADLKTPPPVEYKTSRGRDFVFGKPALKHRGTITKVLKLMASQTADYDAIVKCAKAREISLEQFLKLDEKDLTEDEKRAILKRSDMVENLSFADTMNDILTESLFATVKKAPFLFTTMADFEEKMDDYGEAIELFPIAIKWIAQSAKDLASVSKKN